MAATAPAPVLKVNRCKRCATVLRKARTVCPCCNLDVNAPPEPEPSAVTSSESNGTAGRSDAAPGVGGAGEKKSPRPATAKSGVKICPVCMATVPDAEMVEAQGKRICQGCAERMQKVAAGGAGGPTPSPAAQQSDNNSGSGGGGGMSIEAAASATSNLKSYAHMEERLKKRLYRVKWVLAIFGGVFMVLGILGFLGGGLLNVGADASKNVEENMDQEPEFKKLKPAEREAEKTRMEKERELVKELAWHAKMIGAVMCLVGVFFIVTFFMVNSYPLEASIIALVVFTGNKLYDLSQGFYPGLIGAVVICAIFMSLIDGVLAGAEIKKLRAEKAAAGRK